MRGQLSRSTASSAASASFSTFLPNSSKPGLGLPVLALDVAGVDALEDDRQLPVAERDEEVDLAQVAAGALRVAGLDVLAAGEAGRHRRRLEQRQQRVALLAPVDEQQADVGERVAERAELPVDDRGDLAGIVEDHVVEAVVAVDDRRRSLLGDALGELVVDLLDERDLARLRALPLPLPALQLAPDVVLLLAELAEPDLVGDRAVDLDQRVDDPLADRAAVGLVREGLGVGTLAQDRPLDEVHHVEGRAVDGLVGAVAGDRGDRHGRRRQGGDDRVLAAHVVRGAERLAQRRAAQRPAPARGVGDAVGQVGAAAGDPLVGERPLGSVDVRLEPGADALGVDPLRCVSLLHCHRRWQPIGAGGLIGVPRGRARARGAAGRLRRRPDDQHLGELRRLLRTEGLERGRRPRALPRATARRWRCCAGSSAARSPTRSSSATSARCSASSPAGLIERLFAGLGPDEAMIGAVAAARAAGIRTGLISNSWGTGIYERAPMEIFDATVISGDVGLHKPQPEIYKLGAERIGVAAGALRLRRRPARERRRRRGGRHGGGPPPRQRRTTIAELERLLANRPRPELAANFVLDHGVQLRLAPAARDPLDPARRPRRRRSRGCPIWLRKRGRVTGRQRSRGGPRPTLRASSQPSDRRRARCGRGPSTIRSLSCSSLRRPEQTACQIFVFDSGASSGSSTSETKQWWTSPPNSSSESGGSPHSPGGDVDHELLEARVAVLEAGPVIEVGADPDLLPERLKRLPQAPSVTASDQRLDVVHSVGQQERQRAGHAAGAGARRRPCRLTHSHSSSLMIFRLPASSCRPARESSMISRAGPRSLQKLKRECPVLARRRRSASSRTTSLPSSPSPADRLVGLVLGAARPARGCRGAGRSSRPSGRRSPGPRTSRSGASRRARPARSSTCR